MIDMRARLKEHLKGTKARTVILCLVLLLLMCSALYGVRRFTELQYRNETREEILSKYPVEDVLITELTGADGRVRETIVLDVDTDFPEDEQVALEQYLYSRYGSQIFIFYE